MLRSTISLLGLFAFHPSIAQNALSFDGSNDYCQATNPGPTGNSARTVEAWVNLSVISSTQQVMVTWGEMTVGERYTLNVINGIPRIEVGGSGFSAPNPLGINSWHHIAATYDPATSPSCKLYVDGTLEASGNYTVAVNTSIYGGITVGRRNDSINYFNGRIDDLRIWDFARAASDIATTMDYEYCQLTPGLVGYYSFNQGVAGGNNSTVSTVIDGAPGGNDLAMNGFGLNGASSNFVVGAPVIGNGTSTQTVNTCGPYTASNGIVYTSSGMYVDTLVTPTGCQNVRTLDLTITPLNTAVTISGATLTAQGPGLAIHWLDCNNGFAQIPGATNASFTPSANGSYALQVSAMGCVDTSSCQTITTVGIAEAGSLFQVNVHPNPAKDVLFVQGLPASPTTIRLIDQSGRVIAERMSLGKSEVALTVAQFPRGVHTIAMETSERTFYVRCVLE